MKITGGKSSRSRTRNNYNSLFNSSYKKNNFIKRHPSSWNQSISPEWGAATVSSYATTTDTAATTPTRAALSTIANRELTTSGSPVAFQVLSYYVVEETTNIDLEAQSYEEVINEAEDGELLAIECVCNSPAITVEIVTYGLGNSPNIINNYSMIEMLRRGRGMTPAEVELLPNGRSKDPSGTPLKYYPYLGRYKDDDLVDHLEDERRYFVFRYEPAAVRGYTSIIVNLKNTGVEGNKLVDSINIHRRIYGNPNAEGLVGTPFDETELHLDEEGLLEAAAVGATDVNTAASLEELPPPPANPPPGSGTPPTSNTTSPYIESLFARQKELEEMGEMPELIESDDDSE